EHALCDAGVDAHADADHAYFGQVALIDGGGFGAQLLTEAVDDRLDVVQIAVLDGEADVGGVVIGDVLDDVVDDDVGRGDVAEDPGRDSGPVGHVLDRDAGQVLLECGT